ncbi:MAG: OmpA family protein [Acidiphilium sp.]|nr:OmpA family protein [Acidiphilium sp.]MDD4936154.1 OmpA family protein [Acidiphilium sp.]
MRLTGIATLAFAGGFAGMVTAMSASAQTTGPSASQIIQALKPTGTISATTRGIVPLPPGPGAIAPAPATTPSTLRVGGGTKPTAPSINLNIDFAMGSATLTPRAKTELDRLGHALTDPTLADYKFKLVGHTDTTGSAATNLALSDARAKAVDSYLQSKFNIAAARLAASGVGEQDLLVPTGPNTPNRANRRVQVINIGK